MEHTQAQAVEVFEYQLGRVFDDTFVVARTVSVSADSAARVRVTVVELAQEVEQGIKALLVAFDRDRPCVCFNERSLEGQQDDALLIAIGADQLADWGEEVPVELGPEATAGGVQLLYAICQRFSRNLRHEHLRMMRWSSLRW